MFDVSVRVPATIANLGPGFDALGLAVSLYCDANAVAADADSFVYNGDADKFGVDNLMHTGWREAHKLMGVPAVPIGKVGGDKLTVKTTTGEFSAPLAELHDPWWNSIARAMA